MPEIINRKKDNRYMLKINTIDELKERGLCVIDDEEITLDNNLAIILKNKGLSLSDLAKITGISRQNINAVIKNKMKPGVDFALKVSYVLDVPIEEIFVLLENAWMEPFKQERDETLYLDTLNNEIINNAIKRERIESTKYEYYNVKKNQFLTKEQKDTLLRKYIDTNTVKKIVEIKKNEKNEELTINQIKSTAIEELKAEFSKDVVKIYKRLGKPIIPYKLKK